MRLIVVAIVLSGCFRPGAPADVPCGPGSACPAGQNCIDNVCRSPDFIEPPVDTSTPVDTGVDMTSTCAGGDDVCLVGCVDADPDCETTCGDGRCVGNTGEVCGICPSDCNIAAGCGNGHCEPGESPDCFADCGPVPWPFEAQAQEILDRVNAARTGGTLCPGGAGATTAPALARVTAFDPMVREWAWEIAHQEVFITGGTSCNGRTAFGVRNMPNDFDSFIQSRNHDSVQLAVDSWLSIASLCNSLMEPTRTTAGVAFAFDKIEGYVIVFK